MPRAFNKSAKRLGLAVAAALAAAVAAALAFNTFEGGEPQPPAASDAARPPRVLDRVLVRGSAATDEAPGIDAATDAAAVGAAADADALPRPAPPDGTAVVMAPPARPAPPREPPAPPPTGAARREPAAAPREDVARADAAAPDAGLARRLNRDGIELINAGRPAQAIAPLERAASLQPRDAEILGNLGYAYMLVGEHDTASRHFTRALDVAPTRSATWLNLGQTYAELGQRDRAVDAVVTGYRHATRKDAVRTALMAAATGARYSPQWREAAGMALVRIGDG